MSFSNKVVIITGASSGIGAAAAILFAKEGADVVMIGRNQKALDEVAKQVEAIGNKPLIVNADVSKDGDIARIIKETIAKYKRLDVLVNNAGFARNGSVSDGKVLQAYDEIMSVNVRAVINLTIAATPHLKATKGNIINISSVAALTTPSNPDSLAYYVSKAALDSFTKGTAKELAPFGVRVNSVNPGPVSTNFLKAAGRQATWDDLATLTAFNRVSEPEEIADMIVYLASERARGMTGSIIVHDNGTLLKN